MKFQLAELHTLLQKGVEIDFFTFFTVSFGAQYDTIAPFNLTFGGRVYGPCSPPLSRSAYDSPLGSEGLNTRNMCTVTSQD